MAAPTALETDVSGTNDENIVSVDGDGDRTGAEGSCSATVEKEAASPPAKRQRTGNTVDDQTGIVAVVTTTACSTTTSTAPPCLVVFGLGSAGAEKTRQRHNAGERVVHAIAERRGAKRSLPDGSPADVAETPSCSAAIWRLPQPEDQRQHYLLPPQGHINESGSVLRASLEALGNGSARFLVVVDDCSLPLGTLRLKQKGQSAGHNGLKSIEATYGQAYHRLKIGIGGRATKQHVVGEFESGAEADLAAAVETRAADAVELWLKHGPEAIDKLMSKINSPDFCKVTLPVAQ
eukprot:TRINITY_DN44400_c0_g1_i1.p1 TRINITY_DN44400_c0_g1~~TRINITY_DN44400_c0_g1_i1.p1  ORF type:complete len:305 (-),score=59.00 TRINITY_DN44400_c0_g1_i1:25-900(-)